MKFAIREGTRVYGLEVSFSLSFFFYHFANFFEVNKKKGSFSGIELTTLSLWYANFIETFRVTPINLLFCFFSLSSRIFDKLKRKIHKKSEVLLRLKQ